MNMINNTEYTRTIHCRRSGTSFNTSGVAERLMPGLLYILNGILGRMEPDTIQIRLIFITLSDEQKKRLYSTLEEKLPGIFEDAPDSSTLRETLEHLLDSFSKLPEQRKKICSGVCIDAFDRAHRGKKLYNPVLKRAFELAERLHFDHETALLLEFIYLGNAVSGLNEVLCENSIEQYISIASSVTGVARDRVQQELTIEGRLLSLGIINRDYLPPPHFSVTPEVAHYLDNDTSEYRDDKFLEPLAPAGFTLKDFPVSKENRDTALGILCAEGGSHVLLYGFPGTGKTEFAKALATASGRPAGFLSINPTGDDNSSVSREHALSISTEVMARKGGVMIVDEADILLNSENLLSSRVEKGWLTDLFDSCRTKIIWITNSIEGLHPAVARRFAFSIDFGSFDTRKRKLVWNNLLCDSPLKALIGSETVEELSRDYAVNAGGISVALNVAAGIVKSRKNEPADNLEVGRILRQVLVRHEQLIGRKSKEPKLKPLSVHYDPSMLHTDIDMSGLPDMLQRYYEGSFDRPLNLLFWGMPGTGKTEYAKYLAERTGIPLLIRRASNMVSPLVGETEKAIAETFRRAEEEHAILLIDEADSFLFKRAEARNSWERTQTNELLTGMENFRGVLICCTNNLDLLDHAVIRRFTGKYRFLPLKLEDRVTAFRTILLRGSKHVLKDDQVRRINALEGLTPGDLYTVESTAAFRPEVMPSVEECITALEQECTYRNTRDARVMGFTA